jgi:hypothetical protein
LLELALQPVPEVALHGGCTDPFPLAQPATVDAIQVLLIDGLPECLTGPLAGLDARQMLAKVPPAVQTLRFTHPQLQHAMPQPPVLVPHLPVAPPLVPQPAAAALQAA